ncbi:MAG: hypothetical protein R2741_08040 [Methanolobus sp.]
MLILPSSAYEEITIEYRQADIDNVNRYWYGQGELSVTNPEKPFTLHNNGNKIISFSSTAALAEINEENMVFDSANDHNHLEALFLSQKPFGHGVFTLELTAPYVSDMSDKHVTLKIQNAEKIIYLNKPVFFEGSNTRTEGSYKIIEISNPEKYVKLMFVTNLAYIILTNFMGVSILALALFILVFIRRRIALKTIKEKITCLS